jgi:large subunit ribosomal protein L11
VGKITKAQIMEIVKQKMQDMNTDDAESAARTIAGSARSMGIDVVE